MTQLKCMNCGTETTHADAQIADLHRSCPTPDKYPNGVEHDWIEVEN